MEIEKAKEVLSHIEFIHFRFELEQDKYNPEIYQLKTIVKSPDTRDRTKVIDVYHRYSFSFLSQLDEQRFIRLIFDRTVTALRHEAGELFKINGICPFDEHENNLEKQKFDLITAMFTKDGATINPS